MEKLIVLISLVTARNVHFHGNSSYGEPEYVSGSGVTVFGAFSKVGEVHYYSFKVEEKSMDITFFVPRGK
jgi:hypothetical protein